MAWVYLAPDEWPAVGAKVRKGPGYRGNVKEGTEGTVISVAKNNSTIRITWDSRNSFEQDWYIGYLWPRDEDFQEILFYRNIVSDWTNDFEFT